MTTWFTSDTHIGHNKSEVYQSRGFDCVEDHDEFIRDEWCRVVKDDDTVVIVGDFMMGVDKVKRAKSWFEYLPGREIHYYLGNHCPKVKAWGEYQFSVTASNPLTDEEYLLYFKLEGVHKRVFIHPFEMQTDFVGFEEFDGLHCTIGHLPYAGSAHKTAEIDPREARYPFPIDDGHPRIHGHTHMTEKVSYGACGSVQVHVGFDAWRRFVSAEEVAQLMRVQCPVQGLI